jgi:alkylation response protein AidB-like acyl-CoA dehydrogenase/aminoglycoside phosphotransferase (APT) family kinase protein
METTDILDNHKFDSRNLKLYIDDNLKSLSIDSSQAFEIKQFIHGQSNPTFFINYGNVRLVLRKKPPGKLLRSAHMIDREYRIITALYGKGFPVPRPYIFCSDESVIGTAFYIMEFIDGKVIRDARLLEYSPDEREIVYKELIRVAASLHSYNPEELGLGNYGKGNNYCERQVTVWSKQYRDTETQKIEEMDKLIDWLPKNLPSDGETPIRIVHGDLRLENVIFDRKSLKILAVLDWELSTLGNPLADLSYICLVYYFQSSFFGVGRFDKGSYGIPSEGELKQLYFKLTGFKCVNDKEWNFYLAFCCFRLAGIGQGVYKRSLLGNASSPYANTFKEKTIIVAKTGYRLAMRSEVDSQSRLDELKKQPIFKFVGQHLSDKFYDLYLKLSDFMESDIYTNERVLLKQVEQYKWSKVPDIFTPLKNKARQLGLWNLFLPGVSGLSNLEYAFLCEVMGRSLFLAPEVCNCSAPDTGNMEVLHKYGNTIQKEKYLNPLLNGEIKSCFAMTEKGIASSDATNIQTSIVLDKSGKNYIINGRKWFISGAGDPRCTIAIVMGKTFNNSKSQHNQHSMILAELNTPGIRILRPMSVFGYDDAPHGHMDIVFDNVIVPKENIILGEGKGFDIAQGRLGPGRIHHCMRLIGMAERALDSLTDRVTYRKVFGKLLKDNDHTIKVIAKCKSEIDQARLLVLYAAGQIDQGNAKGAKNEIAMIKVVVPKMAIKVLERAIHVYGAEGFSQDTFLASYYAFAKTLRIADGPDEVHLDTIGKSLIRERLTPKF